ncbi:MAG TPA: mechanosensitive ion channel domain-containing protein [Flavobacteriales bacterium]|nr:mechanosensitive ion channel domain-containing protein [Flavobacteriales bacterium]
MSFFTSPIISLTPTIGISFLNILIWIGLFVAARYTKIAVKRYVRGKNIHKQQITLAGREITFISLAKQVTNIVFVIIALQSLSITNNGSGLGELLDIKLLDLGKDSKIIISVYTISLFIVLIVGAKLLTTFMRLFVQRTMADKKWIDKGKEYTIIMLVQYFIYTVCIVIGMRACGFDLTILLASSAALLVGLGLGIQRIFADIISGFIILFEGTFKVGDIIQVPEGQARIIQINIRTSKARTTGGNVIVLPNSKLTTESINHWSYNNKPVRYSVTVYTEPGSDLTLVKQLLYDCALNHPHVDKKKNIQVVLEEFTESNNNLKLWFWTEKIWEIETIKSDLRFAVEESLRVHGIRTGSPTIKYLDKEKNTN